MDSLFISSGQSYCNGTKIPASPLLNSAIITDQNSVTGAKFLTLNVVQEETLSISKSAPIVTLNLISDSEHIQPISSNGTNHETLFNELYLQPINFDPKPPDKQYIDNEKKRVIPPNIEEWSIQNKLVRPTPTHKSKSKPKKFGISIAEKSKKKQFIEIDLLYGDVERMLILLQVCYPQLKELPDKEVRAEIEIFLKHITRPRN